MIDDGAARARLERSGLDLSGVQLGSRGDALDLEAGKSVARLVVHAFLPRLFVQRLQLERGRDQLAPGGAAQVPHGCSHDFRCPFVAARYRALAIHAAMLYAFFGWRPVFQQRPAASPRLIIFLKRKLVLQQTANE